MSWFEEIFDASSTAASLGLSDPRTAEPLPIENNWRWELQAARSSTHDLEQAAFVEQIVGELTTPEFAFGPGSPELVAFRKIVPIAPPRTTLIVGHEMRDLMKVISTVRKNESERSEAIATMVNEFKHKCPLPDTAEYRELWHRLQRDCAEFVKAAVLAAA